MFAYLGTPPLPKITITLPVPKPELDCHDIIRPGNMICTAHVQNRVYIRSENTIPVAHVQGLRGFLSYDTIWKTNLFKDKGFILFLDFFIRPDSLDHQFIIK